MLTDEKESRDLFCLIIHQVEIGVNHSGQIHTMNNHFKMSAVWAGVFSFHFNFFFFPRLDHT